MAQAMSPEEDGVEELLTSLADGRLTGQNQSDAHYSVFERLQAEFGETSSVVHHVREHNYEQALRAYRTR